LNQHFTAGHAHSRSARLAAGLSEPPTEEQRYQSRRGSIIERHVGSAVGRRYLEQVKCLWTAGWRAVARWCLEL